MKALLKISIFLNLALASGSIFLLTQRPKEIAISQSATPEAPMAQPADSVIPAQTEPVPKPFEWGQLESPNSYRTYIANLRAAGCPGPTI
jgi:hypothetical protein